MRTFWSGNGRKANAACAGAVAGVRLDYLPPGKPCMKQNPIRHLRQFVRVPFDADVLLCIGDEVFTVHLVDIALKGALLQCKVNHAFKLDEKCRLVLPMADDGSGITMSGRIAHLDGEQVGLACTDIDVTSLTRLRRLIELNSGDPSLMNRELLHLFGQA